MHAERIFRQRIALQHVPSNRKKRAAEFRNVQMLALKRMQTQSDASEGDLFLLRMNKFTSFKGSISNCEYIVLE